MGAHTGGGIAQDLARRESFRGRNLELGFQPAAVSVPSAEGDAADCQAATARVQLSVIMPCLNEEKTVQRTLEETAKILRKEYARAFEILVVDDGSTDGTSIVAEAVASKIPEVKVARLHANGGKGNAQRLAFGQATGDVICFLDGDFDIHPRHIVPFVQMLEANGAKVIVGSKRHPDSHIDYPRQRRILSRGYEILLRALFGLQIRDTQAGIKVFRREVLEEVLPVGLVKRYAFDAELLVMAHRFGFSIVEAPIEMASWDEIGSAVDLREVVRMFLDTLGVFLRLRVTKYYDHVPPSEIPRKGS